MKHYLCMVIIFLMPHMSFAKYCAEIGKRCVDGPSTKIIDKFDIYQECWQYETVYECHTDEYADYCSGIKNAPGCEQISSSCKLPGNDGACIEYIDKYQCGNLLKDVAEVQLLDSEYTVTKDELDIIECAPNETNPNCQEVESICVEGAETRNINGKDIYKDCWRYQKKYSCFVGSAISDCEEYKNKCTLIGETCLSQTKNGSCTHTEKKYDCMEVTGNMPIAMNCNSTQYCIGGDCEEQKYEPNKNMGSSISALSVLSNLKNDFNEEECKAGASSCKIFKGEGKYCKINPLSARNCCKNKGWLKDLKILGCNEEEALLAKKRESGVCHHVGSYCNKKILKQCLEKKQSYCCFNSKLARIIHEQGRSQLGISWGSPESPNCQPLTIEQLQKIDFSKVDLRELYGDIMARFKMDKHNTTGEAAKAKVHKKATEYNDEISRRVREYYGN